MQAVTRACRWLDSYAVSLRPPTVCGGAITAGIWIGTCVYGSLLLASFMGRPNTVDSEVRLTFGDGPFPINVTCHSVPGCYVSNFHSGAWSLGVGDAVECSEMACSRMAHLESRAFHLVQSANMHHGLSFLYDNTLTTPDLPRSYGMTVGSMTRCKSCPEGVATVDVPLGPGTSYLDYVLVYNHTSPVVRREEWFSTELTDTGRILPFSTRCMLALTNRTNVAQARVRIKSAYTTVTVTRPHDTFLLIGTIGGGYGMIAQVAYFLFWTVAYGRYFALAGRGVSSRAPQIP